MSNLKLIIAGVAVIALLSGAFIVLKLTEDNDEGGSESAAETVSLWDGSANNIAKVEVKNTRGEYVVTKSAEATDENSSATFTIEQFKDYPLESGYISTIANNFSSLTDARLVEENAADMKKYGLGDNAVKVTVTLDNGTVRSFRLGDESPTSTAECYFCMEGESTVYMVSASDATNYRQSPFFFISKTVLEKPADDSYPVINWLEVERKDLEYGKIRYEHVKEKPDGEGGYGSVATMEMTEPVFAFLDITTSTGITDGMFGLTASEIMKLNPSEDELKVAGLGEETFCRVTMNCDNGKTYKLRLSEKIDVDTDEGTKSFFFGYMEGVNILYYFAAENAPWVYYTPMEIVSGLVLGTYFYDIGTLRVEGGGKILAFEGSGDSEKYDATLNGAEIDSEVFRKFYAFLLKTPADDMLMDEPEGELICSVKLTTQKSKTEETLDFYQIPGTRKVALVHDGKPSFVCRQSYVDRLLSNMELVLNGESIIETW